MLCLFFHRYTILNDLAVASRVVQADSPTKVRACVPGLQALQAGPT